MYDEYARELIDKLPSLGDLDRDACRRALSSAYFHVVRNRVRAERPDVLAQDTAQLEELLRKMANALESVAVFDSLDGNVFERSVESASAFVAGEAVSLLGELQSTGFNTPDVIRDTRHYVKVEAALLYMIGGYDINASAVVRGLPQFVEAVEADLRGATARNGLYLASRLRAMCSGEVREASRTQAPFTGFTDQPVLLEDIGTLLTRCVVQHCQENIQNALP